MKATLLLHVALGAAILIAELNRRGHVEFPAWLLFVLIMSPLVGAVLYIACGPLEGE